MVCMSVMRCRIQSEVILKTKNLLGHPPSTDFNESLIVLLQEYQKLKEESD